MWWNFEKYLFNISIPIFTILFISLGQASVWGWAYKTYVYYLSIYDPKEANSHIISSQLLCPHKPNSLQIKLGNIARHHPVPDSYICTQSIITYQINGRFQTMSHTFTPGKQTTWSYHHAKPHMHSKVFSHGELNSGTHFQIIISIHLVHLN